MKITETDFKKLIPAFMRADKEWRGFCDVLSGVFNELSADLKNLRVWDRIDELSSEELDALADEINVLWYKTTFPIEKKREMIKTANSVYETLGSVYAVETVVGQSFDGTATVKEWFEYGGQPHHFKIETTSANILSGKQLTEFYRILNIVKRRAEWLEKIIIMLKADADGGLFVGDTLRDTGVYKQFVENRFPYDPRSKTDLTSGVIYHDASFDNITLK